MANGMNGTPKQQRPVTRQGVPARNGNPPKKADVIIQITRDISRKQEDVRNQTQLISTRLDTVAEISNQSRENAQEAINKSDVVYNLVADGIAGLKHELTYLAMQSENIYLNLTEKLAELNKAVDDLMQGKAVSEQYEAVEEAPDVAKELDYDAIADKLAERLPQSAHEASETVIDYDLLSDKIAGKMPAPVQQYSAEGAPVATVKPAEIDYDELSAKVASLIPVQEAISTDYIASKVAEQIVVPASAEIDYEALAKKVAEQIGTTSAPAPTPVVVTSGGDVTIDYEYLADKVAGKILASKEDTPADVPVEIDYDTLSYKLAENLNIETSVEAAPVEIDYEVLADKVADRIRVEVPEAAPVEIDYEVLADKVAERIHIEASEATTVEIDYEVLADKVAERIHIEAPEATPVEIDYEVLADKVADRIHIEAPVTTAAGELDLNELADKIAERVPVQQQVQTVAAALPVSQTAGIDEDELADKIALKVGSLKSDDFDIIVDDDGCDSISKAIAEKLDYDYIAEVVSEKLRVSLDMSNGYEPDYDEMANRIGEKISVTPVSEDAIADRAAAVLSNYLPEIDTDEIADKVANQVLAVFPATKQDNEGEELDLDALADKVADRVVSSLPQKEEGEEEALQIELDYEDLAEKVANHVISCLPEGTNGGEAVVVSQTAQISEEDLDKVADKITKTSGERFDSVDKDLEEIKSLLESGVKVAELAPAAAEQTITEDNEVLVTVSDIMSETEESTDEQTYEDDDNDPKTLPSEDEESLEIGDELSETSGGVDFLNMMKYNRSFIARIIQGTDDQKQYYGRIKHALLGYKKVNSNIAWGAERFHKGRETIARLKIRGKTLILYLALDPAEFPYSVYHHKDVSDNKSLHGTPLSVKVMSPLGVKKAIRLIDAMLEKRDGIKRPIPERDYTEMYPYETIEELIADGLVQDVRKP
ncbi:MAG: hypothetical protein J1G05_04970 [Clostridiales bacterium]|nr:hypothetical protein [Clostridiales bacterium]